MTQAKPDYDDQADKTLDKDAIHEILSNPRRRAALRILDENGPMEKGELSTLVAADEYDKDPEQLTSDERKRVHISLYQQHNDVLKDANVINSNGEIMLTQKADDLLWHLEAEPNQTLCDKIKSFVSNLRQRL